MPVEFHPVDVEQDLAREAVAVGVQPRRPERDDDVARPDPIGTEHGVGLHHADPGGGQVVVVLAHQSGMLCRLAAQQGAPGPHAALRDAGDELGDLLRDHPTDGDVVL